MNHTDITNIMTAQGRYGTGVTPNPYAEQDQEWRRRRQNAAVIEKIRLKIISLYEPRFITPPHTSEFIESLVTMMGAMSILELGSLTGFTTLHILRAIVGKDGAKVVAVDRNPEHDVYFFAHPDIARHFEHINGSTPECLAQLNGRTFDLVFIDSDHSVEHCQREFGALLGITKPGALFLFHDVPEWQTPDNRTAPPVRFWLDAMVRSGRLAGAYLPTSEQMDCLSAWGPGYPRQCNPHLGVFVRVDDDPVVKGKPNHPAGAVVGRQSNEF